MAIELATAYVSLSTSAKGLRKEIDAELGAAGDAAGRKAGKSFGSRLSSIGKAGAVAAGGAIAAGFGTALVKGFGRLKAIEQAEAKLSGLGHSAAEVEKIMANAGAAVKGTSFGLGDAASAAASAVAAGVKPGKDLERTLKLVGDAAAIAGADYGEMASIFNKVSAGGVIQGEELAQLGDRGIPILQLLGKELGVSAQEVRKLASEGKIDFETFQNAMESGMGGAALESGKTFSGAMSNVGAALGRLGADLLSGVFPKIAPMLSGVIGWLDKMAPAAKAVGEAIGDAMSWAGTAISGLFDLVVKGDFSAKFRETFNMEEDHPFVGFLFTVRENAVAAFGYLRDTAIPAVKGFFDGLSSGEGTGGKFRDILTAVGDAAKVTFGWIRDEGLPALMALGDFILKRLWPDIKTAFLDNIIPAMVEVGRVIKNFWEGDAQPALRGLWEFIKNILAPFLVDFYENGIKPTFRLIGDAIAGAWNNVIKPTFQALKDGGDQVKERFVTVKDGIKTAWDQVSSIVSGGWDKIRGVFDKFKAGLSSLKDRFSNIKDGIAQVWRGLTNAIARPMNAVIDKVNQFLSALKDGLNKIPGVDIGGNWSIRKIILDTSNATIGGGPNQMLAAGGAVRGWSPHDRADNIPAMLTAGEYVLPVRATRSLASRFGPGFLESLRRGLPGYASGGMVGARRPRTGGPGVLEAAGDFLAGLWEDAKGWTKKLWDRLMPDFGGSWVGMAAKGALSKVDLSGLASWVKSQFASTGGGGGVNYPGPYGQHPTGMSFARIFEMIRSVVPDAIMTSGQRGPGNTASGIPSLHGKGRAVDWIIPNMFGRIPEMIAAFRRVGALMPWSQHFFTQAGPGSQHGFVDDIIRRTHRDHAHTALADGGLVKPLLFDSGGYLPTGTSLVHNGTRKPEPLGRMDRPMRISGTCRLIGDGSMIEFVDARIDLAQDHSDYQGRMVLG